MLSLFLEAHEFYKSYLQKQALSETPDHYAKIAKFVDYFQVIHESIFKVKVAQAQHTVV